MHYFAYGSNLDWAQMRQRCPSARFISVAKLPDHKLAFTRKSITRGCGVVDVIPQPNAEVWGAVFEIDERDIGSLDKSEGFSPGRVQNSYTREERHVLTDGDAEKPLAAVIYIAQKENQPPLPNAEYKALIVEGAKFWHLPPHYVAELEKIEVAGTNANPARGAQMANKTVQMTTDQYRHFVAVQYLNASNALFEGLKTQQGKNSFHFMTTLRSFIEYTRRGIWFLAWATDQQLRAAQKLTFQRPGSPSLEKMDMMINDALGEGKVSHLMNPIKEINNEPFLHLLHALTHGNPISVRMVSFGVDKMFQTDKLLMRAETDLNLFRVLLYRRMLGEQLTNLWKTLGPIHNEPETMKANAMIAAKLVKDAGLADSFPS